MLSIKYSTNNIFFFHRIPWPQGFPKCREISDMNCQYFTGNYGAAIVIFDDYKQSSTKDMKLQRRTGGKTMTSITFSNDMKPTVKKDHFLYNSSNKQFFINMLSRYLQKVVFRPHHSQADAHLLIDLRAMESARRANTVFM